MTAQVLKAQQSAHNTLLTVRREKASLCRAGNFLHARFLELILPLLGCREMTAPFPAWQEPTAPIAPRFVTARTTAPVPLWMGCATAKKVTKFTFNKSCHQCLSPLEVAQLCSQELHYFLVGWFFGFFLSLCCPISPRFQSHWAQEWRQLPACVSCCPGTALCLALGTPSSPALSPACHPQPGLLSFLLPWAPGSPQLPALPLGTVGWPWLSVLAAILSRSSSCTPMW